MKCLSVCQPFAELIVSGRKTVELRPWNTKFRGEFLVHAPIKVRDTDCRRLETGTDLPVGVIVGRAEVYDVRRYETEQEMMADSDRHMASAPGKYRYGFILRNARRLRIPVPCKGSLGFFEADLPVPRIGRSDLEADIIDEEHRYRWIGRH